jgi:hypothetical protein
MLRRAADYLDGLAYRLIPEAQAVLDEVNASRQDGAP